MNELDKNAVLVLPIIQDAVRRDSYSVGSNSSKELKAIVCLLIELGYLEYVGYTSYDGAASGFTAHYNPTDRAREWLRLRIVKGITP